MAPGGARSALPPATGSLTPRSLKAVTTTAWQMCALLVVALSSQGCSFITIGYCHTLKFQGGHVEGTWQGDRSVVQCDAGSYYKGEAIKCEVSTQCSYRYESTNCTASVALVFAEAVGEARRLTKRLGGPELAMQNHGDREHVHSHPPESHRRVAASELRCVNGSSEDAGVSSGEAGPSAKQVKAWALKFYSVWNNHSGDAVAAAFDRDGRERSWDKDVRGPISVGKANQDIFDMRPHMSIEVLKVNALPANRTAFVELRINMNDGTNKTLSATDTIEFTDSGRIWAMRGSLAAISDRLPAARGGEDPRSLKIEGLPPNSNDLYLYRVFSRFGALRRVHAEENEDGTCTGVGFVEFAVANEANNAREVVDGHALNKVDVKTSISSNDEVVLHVSVQPPEVAGEEQQ